MGMRTLGLIFLGLTLLAPLGHAENLFLCVSNSKNDEMGRTLYKNLMNSARNEAKDLASKKYKSEPTKACADIPDEAIKTDEDVQKAVKIDLTRPSTTPDGPIKPDPTTCTQTYWNMFITTFQAAMTKHCQTGSITAVSTALAPEKKSLAAETKETDHSAPLKKSPPTIPLVAKQKKLDPKAAALREKKKKREQKELEKKYHHTKVLDPGFDTDEGS